MKASLTCNINTPDSLRGCAKAEASLHKRPAKREPASWARKQSGRGRRRAPDHPLSTQISFLAVDGRGKGHDLFGIFFGLHQPGRNEEAMIRDGALTGEGDL